MIQKLPKCDAAHRLGVRMPELEVVQIAIELLGCAFGFPVIDL